MEEVTYLIKNNHFDIGYLGFLLKGSRARKPLSSKQKAKRKSKNQSAKKQRRMNRNN